LKGTRRAAGPFRIGASPASIEILVVFVLIQFAGGRRLIV